MPAYDATRFSPPAPLAQVTLRRLDTGASVPDVPMRMDYGADITLVPREVASRLGAALGIGRAYELVGFDGSKSVAQSVQLDLVFLKRAFKGQFLLIEQPWGILGRDILNHLAILLDGPHLAWNEYHS